MIFSNTRSVVASNRLSAICSKLGSVAAILCVGAMIMLATGCESSESTSSQPAPGSSEVGSEAWMNEQLN